MWPIEIECLKSGGAMVFALDHQSRQQALRFTEKGDLHSQFSLAFPERGPAPVDHRRFVDEERGHITFTGDCWRGFCRALGKPHVHVAVFSLEEGTKRWESAFQSKENSSSSDGFSPKLMKLRKDGSLELRTMVRIQKTKTDWLRWSVSQGIPSPERRSVEKSVPSRTIISSTDGSVRDTSLKHSLSNWFKVHAGEDNASTRETFVLGGGLYNYSAGNIECADPRIWLPRHPHDSSMRRQRCFRIVRTS